MFIWPKHSPNTTQNKQLKIKLLSIQINLVVAEIYSFCYGYAIFEQRPSKFKFNLIDQIELFGLWWLSCLLLCSLWPVVFPKATSPALCCSACTCCHWYILCINTNFSTILLRMACKCVFHQNPLKMEIFSSNYFICQTWSTGCPKACFHRNSTYSC